MAIGYLNKGGSAADLDAITATAPDVLLDKVILNKDGDPIKGTMPNNGSWSSSGLKAGATVSVPLGYHNGKGTVTADTLANQTPANANTGQILRNQTAWVNGSLVTGTMNNYSGNTSTSNPVASTFRSATTGYVYASPGGNGYYTTGSYLRIPASNLSAANIKKGVNVMGIIGTFEGSAESRLELFTPSAGAKNGFLNSPSRVNNSGNGHDDYEGYSSYGTLTTWIHQSGSYWHECLYRLSNDIILTPFRTITFTIDCFPCNYEGKKIDGNPASIKKIGVGSTGMTSNSFSAVLDCPNEVSDGRYNVNIASLTGTFRFYIYMQVTGGGSRYSSGSRINLIECYLTA